MVMMVQFSKDGHTLPDAIVCSDVRDAVEEFVKSLGYDWEVVAEGSTVVVPAKEEK